MNGNIRKYLVLGIAIVMIASSMSILYAGFNGTHTSSNNKVNPYQQDFAKSMSTGAPVQMTTENFSGVQQKLSTYSPSAMPGNERISFLVNFKVSNPQGLSAYINEENNVFSPYYHKYLTSADFQPGAAYGPSQTVYTDTITYYQGQGFTLEKKYPLAVEFTGYVSQVNSAFRTHMVSFTQNGVTKYSNYQPLSIPTVLSASVSSIDGLNNLLAFKPDSMIASPAQSGTAYAPGITSSALTNYLNHSDVINYSRHAFAWGNVPGFGYSQFLFPTTMPALYNATGLVKQGYNGKGITIAVVMEQGYNPSDLSTYATEAFGNGGQILHRITNYPVNGALNASNATYWNWQSGGAGEFTLDIEYSATMAPGAHIDAVYGPDLSTMSLDTAYQALVSLPKTPNIVTNSWGGDEDLWFNLYGSSFQNAYTMNSLFEVLTSMGSTVLFSSGDSAGVGALTNFLTPSFGATSPYVVGVGGVRTVANSTQGLTPTGNVSNFTLSPYSNQPAGISSLWYPNFPLQIGNASGIATQSYWYTSQGGTPYAGGQVGLSYWFNQSAYQHGPGIPFSGRQNTVAVSGEADFNETEYFTGMWVFFWGGTSFACPTVAGEVADILSYTNATIGLNYSGNFNAPIYMLGNFAYTFGNSPFYNVTNGSNPWAAQNQEFGWPNGLAYPTGWTNEHKGYTFLTGWGTINAYVFAHDTVKLVKENIYALKNLTSGNMISAAAGTTLNSGINYTLTVENATSKSPQASAAVNFAVYASNGSFVKTFNPTSNATGNVTFNTAGFGNDTVLITITHGLNVSYWYVFINNVLKTGTLKVTVLQSTVMGGFAAFNNMLSPGYPGFAPLFPNTVEVQVTLNGVPVSGAYVLAQQAKYSPMYSAVNETSTSFRSVGFTNVTGIAFVETWNVGSNSMYYVNATYENLSASSTMNVTPQYSVLPTNSNQAQFDVYTGIISLPAASPGTSYTVQEQVFNYNQSTPEKANVSVGFLTPYPTFVLQNMIPVTTTNKTGVFNLTISDAYLPGLYFLNVTQIGGTIAWYNGFALNNPSSYIPVLIGGAGALPGEVGVSSIPTSQTLMGSLYAGQNWTEQGTVFTNYQDPLFGQMYINASSTTGPTYWFDSGAIQMIAAGTPTTDPQDQLAFNIAIPVLSIGLHTFNMEFNDTLYGITYTYTQYFYIISNSNGTAPVVGLSIDTATSPHITANSVAYYTGTVNFNLTNSENAFTTSTVEITNNAATVDLYFNVNTSTFSYNFNSLAPGKYTVTYTTTNPNGESTSYSVALNTQSTYSVKFTEAGLSSGTAWSVTFNGKQYNSTSSTITVSGLLPGNYSYTVSNVSGYNTPGSGTISVSGNSAVNVAYSSTSSSTTITTTVIIYIVVGVVGGLAAGIALGFVFGGRKGRAP